MERREGEKHIKSFVSQDDESFRKSEKEFAQEIRMGSHDFAFGSESLRFYRETEEFVVRTNSRVTSGELAPDVAEKYNNEDRECTVRLIHRKFEYLLSLFRHFPNVKKEGGLMIEEALRDPLVMTAWGDNRPLVKSDEEFWRLFNENKVPKEVLIAILEQRERRQEKIQKEWEPKFEHWREEFRAKVHHAVSEGLLPPNEHYDQRIDDVEFLVSDPVAMRNALGRSHGAGILSIQVEFREETFIRKTVFHEMVHHIAGGAIQKTETERYEHGSLQFKATRYVNRKHGLAFNTDNETREKGDWINEGMTELLARNLAGVDIVTSYRHEQNAILNIIRSGAVPQKLFIDAYFEGHLARPEDGSRLPAFRALNKAMTKAYGAGWMKRIGEMIDEKKKEPEETSSL